MKKLCLLLCSLLVCVASFAQTRTVTGKVVQSGDEEPLVGATVLPVGGGTGTSTDVDGNFTLRVPESVKKLVVSYVGMVTQEVAITGQPMLVKLNNASNELDEVMVVAYGTAKKSAYTGSASVVKSDALENALITTVTDALSGKVAGVQTLSNNGQPGSAPKIRIRGVGSINAGTAPLYVVDGVPYDGSISDINTMDVESMTVLKDAAAAALYGARGANGVILITTKAGRVGATKITLDARWGSNSSAIPNYDVIKSVDQFTELAYTALYNGYYYNLGSSAAAAHRLANANIPVALGYQVYTVDPGEFLIGTDGKINPNARLGYSDGQYYYRPDDWIDGTFRNGLRQEYNVSISGGSDRFNYYVSGSYLGDDGLIEGSHFQRMSARTTMDYQAKKWLKIGTSMSYTYTNSGDPGDQTNGSSSANAFFLAYNIAPYYPLYVRDANGNIMHNEKYGHKIYDYGDGKSTNFKRNFMKESNPAGTLLYDTEDYLTDVFSGKWYIQLTPIEGLTVTGTLGSYVSNMRYHGIGNPFYGGAVAYGGSASQGYYRTRALNLQGLANYRRTFNNVHDVDLLLGYESYDYNYETLTGNGYNLYMPDSWAMYNVIDRKNTTGRQLTYATRGIFARANYSFDARYFASVSFRRDASSRFAPDQRWGNFWSVSGAWDAAKEQFTQDLTWLDQLKVKASFGQQGNDDLLYDDGTSNYYPYQDQYRVTGANGIWSDGELYYKGNSKITWETSNNFNAGIDFSVFNSMLSGTVEYFNRQTSDMLYNKPVSPSNGYSSIPMNIGSMRNNGVEIELNYRPVDTKNITWDINYNITFINNKILKLHPDLNGELISGSRIYREGRSMYELYLPKYMGVDPTTGLALYLDRDPIVDEDGNQIEIDGELQWSEEYLSTNGAHAYSNNRKATGNLMPKAYGGFGTTLNAYGFDFSISFAYQFGGKIWDYTYQDLMHGGTGSDMGRNWHKDILNAWTPENPNSNIPRLDAQDSYTNYTSDRWLVSSNYLSINNITLGYTLPSKLTKKFYLEKVRIYGSAENVALWSARKGLDPRQGYLTSDGATYKGIRCISGGIRVEF